MSWSGSGQQTGVNASLSGITTVSGVSSQTVGAFTIYTVNSGTFLDIQGTLTINPEIEKLILTSVSSGNTSPVLKVSSTGKLNLGKTETVGGYERFTRGTAIESVTAQSPWWGINGSGGVLANLGKTCLIEIESGGELDWRGATIGGYATFVFNTGSSIWVQDGIVNNVVGPGTNNTAGSGRGSIFWIKTTDIRIDGLTLLQSGEFIYTVTPSGTNSQASLDNGVSGIIAKQTVFPFFPNRAETARALDFELGQNGNTVDYVIQSDRNELTDSQVTKVTIDNEKAGSDCFTRCAESGSDLRNGGYLNWARIINFDFRDGISLSQLSDGRCFIRDTNNSARKNLNGEDDTADLTYSETFSSGELSSDIRVVYAIINVARGATLNTDNNVVTSTSANGVASYDLRGKVNTKGSDTFDIHIWRYENQYISLADTDLSDGTTGTLILTPRAVEDVNITSDRSTIKALSDSLGSDFAISTAGITHTGSTSITLDDVYDLTKYHKESSEAQIQIPTTSTFLFDTDGTELDLGTLTITQGTGLWKVGVNHTKVTHDTALNAGNFELSGGIELTAPSITDLPATVGTSTLNPTNTMTTDKATQQGAGSVINGPLVGSIQGVSYGGNITGSSTTTGVGDNTQPSTGTIGGAIDWAAGDHTLAGASSSTVDLKVGDHELSGEFADTVDVAAGDSVFSGEFADTVDAAAGNHTFSGDFTKAVVAGAGNQTLSGNFTETVTIGAGVPTVSGNLAKILTAGNGNMSISGDVHDVTHGTGTFALTVAGSMDGTLRKSGSGNSNSVTMTPAQAATVTLIVASGTIELFGASRADYLSVTGLTNNNAAATTTVVTIPSSYPSGKYIIELSTTADSQSKTVNTFTTGTDLEILNITNPETTATYIVYFKPTDVITGDETTSFVYQPVIQSISTSGTNQSFNVNESAIDQNLLTSLAEEATVGTELATFTFNGASTTTGLINISGATSGAGLPADRTQKLILSQRDSDNYLILLSNIGAAGDVIINPGSNQETQIDNDIVLLNATRLNIVTAVVGTNPNAVISTTILDGSGNSQPSVLVFKNELGATSTQIGAEVDARVNDILDERLLTANNQENLGLGTPIVKDGALAITYHSS